MSAMTFVAGTARADITPDPAMLNWVDLKPYDGVIDPLFVRALFLSDGACSSVVLSWDLIDVVEETAVRVRQAIARATGVPESHVLIVATHTHSGPRCPFGASSVVAGRLVRLKPLLDDAVFLDWGARLPEVCASVVQKAQAAAAPVAIAIGRANAAEWLFNRRPVDADGNAVTMFTPKDPYSLPDGLRFGPMDPTLTALSLRNAEDQTVATLFSVPCHAVSVYPHHRGISADWPGAACRHLVDALGGEALFLQGCAGDLVPAKRGLAERDRMARFFADRAIAAVGQRYVLPPGALKIASSQAALPVTPEARSKLGADTLPGEVQVLAFGDFALVALPGEPLNGLAREILARSPFPHTLVIGYANGRSVGYVGLPGEKAKGGYEAGAGSGTEEAGLFFVETAVRLLHEVNR